MSRIVIIGGVAGGASAAARARRMSESSEIIMLERGEFVSFANCGLPYHISGEIPSRANLVLQTPESFKRRFNVDVRVMEEVVQIDRQSKSLRIKRLADNSEYELTYDKLLLSPGAAPVVPPVRVLPCRAFSNCVISPIWIVSLPVQGMPAIPQ